MNDEFSSKDFAHPRTPASCFLLKISLPIGGLLPSSLKMLHKFLTRNICLPLNFQVLLRPSMSNVTGLRQRYKISTPTSCLMLFHKVGTVDGWFVWIQLRHSKEEKTWDSKKPLRRHEWLGIEGGMMLEFHRDSSGIFGGEILNELHHPVSVYV